MSRKAKALEKEEDKDGEECWSKDTALFHAAFNVKGVGHAALVQDAYFHVVLERSDAIVLLVSILIWKKLCDIKKYNPYFDTKNYIYKLNIGIAEGLDMDILETKLQGKLYQAIATLC